MWDFITPKNLLDFQRRAALEQMGQHAATLHAEGYSVDSDRVLDEMLLRKARWSA